jgi:hypothetical protein
MMMGESFLLSVLLAGGVTTTCGVLVWENGFWGRIIGLGMMGSSIFLIGVIYG